MLQIPCNLPVTCLPPVCNRLQIRDPVPPRAPSAQAAKLSHTLQTELQELERTIALQIRHRMEVMNPSKYGKKGGEAKGEVKRRIEATDRRRYEKLTYLVRVNPGWLAQLLVRTTHEKAPLVQLIVFVLYADMHDLEEDRLLLQLFGEALSIETKKCTDIGEFMRSNTPLTDCLSKYNTREPSKEALLAMLKEPMAHLQVMPCHAVTDRYRPLRMAHLRVMPEGGEGAGEGSEGRRRAVVGSGGRRRAVVGSGGQAREALGSRGQRRTSRRGGGGASPGAAGVATSQE